jgi:hypothetical protein
VHTKVSAVQFFGQFSRWPDGVVYVGMPGKPSRAFGIPDEVAVFGKPWECVNSPAIFGGAPDWPTAFMRFAIERMTNYPKYEEAVRALHGKTLLCWCAKKGAPRCHAAILADLSEMLFHGPSLDL